MFGYGCCYKVFIAECTAFAIKCPRGIVYSANVALNRPMGGSNTSIASSGKPYPIGHENRRNAQLTIVIIPTLSMIPKMVEEVITMAWFCLMERLAKIL